jgi:LPS-assembly lipoprotein
MRHLRLLFVSLLLVALAGCGFQLRGSVDLPQAWRQLYLDSASPNSELSTLLRTGLESNGIALLDATTASYLLYLGNEKFERNNLTIGGNAQAQEFELTMSTSLRVTDKAGQVLMADTPVEVHKVITNDPNNVTGKAEEVRLLQREMRQDLVQQLLRKLRFLATSPAGQAAS